MKVFLFCLIGFIFINYANAQWLCREASSISNGHTITACGVGESKSLEEARVKSRESAVEEFKRICNLSIDCSEYDYSVVPKRTDCEFKNNNYTCYRALDFEISDKKKKSITVDLSELQSEVNLKNQEIQQLQNRIGQINQLKKSQEELSLKKKELSELEDSLNKREAEALKLEDLKSKETVELNEYRYIHQVYENSIKIAFYYWDSKLTDDSEKDILWIASYEKRPYNWLGLQLIGGFGSGRLDNQKTSDEDVPTMGAPSTTSYFNGAVSYLDIGVCVLAYSGWNGTYIKGDLGLISGRKSNYTVNYNGSGVGTPQKSTENFTKNYIGLSMGFDTRDDKKGWGSFFELGVRKLSDQNRLGTIGSIGINYGY